MKRRFYFRARLVDCVRSSVDQLVTFPWRPQSARRRPTKPPLAASSATFALGGQRGKARCCRPVATVTTASAAASATPGAGAAATAASASVTIATAAAAAASAASAATARPQFSIDGQHLLVRVRLGFRVRRQGQGSGSGGQGRDPGQGRGWGSACLLTAVFIERELRTTPPPRACRPCSRATCTKASLQMWSGGLPSASCRSSARR